MELFLDEAVSVAIRIKFEIEIEDLERAVQSSAIQIVDEDAMEVDADHNEEESGGIVGHEAQPSLITVPTTPTKESIPVDLDQQETSKQNDVDAENEAKEEETNSTRKTRRKVAQEKNEKRAPRHLLRVTQLRDVRDPV